MYFIFALFRFVLDFRRHHYSGRMTFRCLSRKWISYSTGLFCCAEPTSHTRRPSFHQTIRSNVSAKIHFSISSSTASRLAQNTFLSRQAPNRVRVLTATAIFLCSLATANAFGPATTFERRVRYAIVPCSCTQCIDRSDMAGADRIELPACRTICTLCDERCSRMRLLSHIATTLTHKRTHTHNHA